jgi:rhodanese-related sulfurtransferase
MKRYAVWAAVLMLVVLAAMPAYAANYVKPDEFKQWLEGGAPPVIVDIQPVDDYEKHHFRGSFETNAFPARTEEEKLRLDAALPKIRASKDAVVVVCPRGRSGASNAYDLLVSKGIPENRLFILEGGIAGWPYADLLMKGR